MPSNRAQRNVTTHATWTGNNRVAMRDEDEFGGEDGGALGQNNIGMQMLLKMGWNPRAGLGLNGTGRREPVNDHVKAGGMSNTHDYDGDTTTTGVALLSERRRLESTPETDWKKGQADWRMWEDLSHYFQHKGTLDDYHALERVDAVETQQPYVEIVDPWDDTIIVEEQSTGRQVRFESRLDAQDRMGKLAAASKIDKTSTSPDHFFACCKLMGPNQAVQVLCIETTGEIFQREEFAATGGELKKIFQNRTFGLTRSTKQSALRVMLLRHVCVADSEEPDDGTADSEEPDDGTLDEPIPENLAEDNILSTKMVDFLSHDFPNPRREIDEESISSRATETSVVPGWHARERTQERGIREEQIRTTKQRGKLVLSVEQKRGGDPEMTTYQINCKKEKLREIGRLLTRKFPGVAHNEPKEVARRAGIHRRIEMLLEGSEGLGPDVKKFLLSAGFFDKHFTCPRCSDKHVHRLTFKHEISQDNVLVVVEGLTQTSPCGLVTTYFQNRRRQKSGRSKEPAGQQLSLFSVTRKPAIEDKGHKERNPEASRLLGFDVFGRAYIICRSDFGNRVTDYRLEDFIRDFPAGSWSD